MKPQSSIIAISFLLFLVPSCEKKLDLPPIGFVEELRLANKKGVEGLLIGAYSLLDGIAFGEAAVGTSWGGAGSNWILGSICGSEAYKGSEPYDQIEMITPLETFTANPLNQGVVDKWKAVYSGVARANLVLRMMTKAEDIPEADKKRIEAEARFLRGFYHFEAIKIWKHVPYVDEKVTYEDGNYFLPNDTPIWGAIENDFRFAMDSLSEVMDAPGRVNKYAAGAFLAKAYLFQGKDKPEKFNAAKLLLEDLMNNGVTAKGIKYALLPHYHDNFNPESKNSSESVFAAQTSVNDGSGGANGNLGDVLNFPFYEGPGHAIGPGRCCGFFKPSQYLVNHFKTDPQSGLPDLDNYNLIDVKNDDGINSTDTFSIDTGPLDPRLDWTVGRRGIPFLDWGDHPGDEWTRNFLFGTGCYNPMKNSYSKSQEDQFTDASFWSKGAVANNINLIRFADILLWAAEVEIEIGTIARAIDYINQVRARAANQSGWVQKPTGAFAPFAANYKIELYTLENVPDRETARKVVRYERMLELAMEGHRFFDLVRWGIADQEINAYIENEKKKRSQFVIFNAKFIKGKHEYFPIPQKQIDLSAGPDGIPKMKQNPGY